MASNSVVVFDWLSRLGLQDAIPAFAARGITTPAALIGLTFQEYDDLGVASVADRRRLFDLVHRVREVRADESTSCIYFVLLVHASSCSAMA